MSSVAEKVLRLGRRASIILEFAVGPFHWYLVPSAIYFPPDSPWRLGGSSSRCHDFTLAWLRFGITLRFEP